MHRLWGLAVLLAAGCLREKVQYCDNGALCPEPLVCTERADPPFCGVMGQVEECLGQPDETACTVDMKKGVCDAGICIECIGNNAACIYDDWVAMELPSTAVDLNALYVAGPREVYVAGTQGSVLRWDGKRWTPLPATGMGDLTVLAGASPTDLWAAGATSSFHFDGTAWAASVPTANFSFFGIWAAGPSNFFSANARSTLGRNTGGAWSYMEQTLDPLVVNFNAVWGTSPTDVFVVGGLGTIVHWNGTSWSSPQPTPAMHTLLAVHGTGSTNVFATGRNNASAPVVFRYDGSWQDLTPNLPSSQLANVNLNGVWTTAGHVFAVGHAETVVHSMDNGQSWTIMPTPGSTSVLTDVAGSGKSVFAVGTKGTVLRYTIP